MSLEHLAPQKKESAQKKITMVGDVRRTEEPTEGAPSNQSN